MYGPVSIMGGYITAALRPYFLGSLLLVNEQDPIINDNHSH